MRRPLAALLPLALAGCDSLDSVISAAQDRVRHDLRDGDSAKFRDVRRCGNSKIVTGEVNAKNAYGAYVGFKAFVVEDYIVAFMDSDTATSSYGSDQFVILMTRCTAAIEGKPLPDAANITTISPDTMIIENDSMVIDEPPKATRRTRPDAYEGDDGREAMVDNYSDKPADW